MILSTFLIILWNYVININDISLHISSISRLFLHIGVISNKNWNFVLK